jgi:hypothetical protein
MATGDATKQLTKRRCGTRAPSRSRECGVK